MIYDRPTDTVVVLLVNRSEIPGVEATANEVVKLVD